MNGPLDEGLIAALCIRALWATAAPDGDVAPTWRRSRPRVGLSAAEQRLVAMHRERYAQWCDHEDQAGRRAMVPSMTMRMVRSVSPLGFLQSHMGLQE